MGDDHDRFASIRTTFVARDEFFHGVRFRSPDPILTIARVIRHEFSPLRLNEVGERAVFPTVLVKDTMRIATMRRRGHTPPTHFK
jgi:hypothetical protein